VDVFDFLRGRIVESLVWRQRLPLVGAAWEQSEDEIAAEYMAVLDQLRADLANVLSDRRFLAAFLKATQPS
jgi:hypothetical protein